jgi:hypothetical protein
MTDNTRMTKATTEPLFEPTDYDRRKNVERALITQVNDLHVKINKAEERLTDLLADVDKAQAALMDFYVLEPPRADMNGVIDAVAEVVNSGALDRDGMTVRVEARP